MPGSLGANRCASSMLDVPSGIVRADSYKIVARKWSCRFAPTPGRSAITSMPSGRRSSAGPMPDSSSSCGDPIVPPHTITSPEQRSSAAGHSPEAGAAVESAAYVRDERTRPVPASLTPAARPVPSKTRRATWAPVMTVSSGLSSTGCTNEVQALIRRPFLTVRWVRPAPRMLSALGSSFSGTP